MTLAKTERAALAELFIALGPDQPTLCEGWQTAELLSHLLVRERRPDAALGVMLKPLAGHTAAVAAGFAKRPWTEQVSMFRSGPPAWNPMGWGKVDELANGAEMFIHHEDARRGQPDWEPRELGPDDFAQVVGLLSSPLTRMALGKGGPGLSARITDSPSKPDRVVELRSGAPLVQISGGAAEILLWTSGRRQVRVQLDGDPAAVAEVGAPKSGL